MTTLAVVLLVLVYIVVRIIASEDMANLRESERLYRDSENRKGR
jgi:hypothetical protein